MTRLSPYLAILAALLMGALLAVVYSDASISRAPTQPASDTPSTISIQPIPAAPATIPSPESPVPMEGILVPEPAPIEETSIKTAPVSAPTTLSPSESAALLDASASALRAALVNIICNAPAGGGIRSISGSGVIVDPKGIILTNAHIAQYFLLADKNVTCKIRTGSPAAPAYKAALIYIPSKWIVANANVLGQTNPMGTGERDFAFLAVTRHVRDASLPSPFPFIALANKQLASGAPVVIASYGAQFLESSQTQSSLFPTVVFGSIKDVFTFAGNTVDVFALGGSAAAQEGSSGGGVSNMNGELAGTITTSTTEGPTSVRSLFAITAPYIRAEYARSTGQALDLLLARPTSISILNFAPQMPALTSIITAHLP